jgi:ATP-dependent helicase/nuclease subunit A
MSGARIIPPEARARQQRASDPAASVFVSANAGSGKTHVLVQRVVRLLLSGVAPEKILCITFTKAAAANMAERVFATLGRWIALDATALDAALIEAGAVPSAATRKRARELFACALETPGGLKVQTIHALCTRLLQQFPFEANVPARFAVLDDRDQAELMERASLKVLLDAAAAPGSLAGEALLTAMAGAADVTFREVVREAVLSRDHFQAWTRRTGTLDVAVGELSRALGVADGDTVAAIERQIVDGPYLPRADWAATAARLATGSKSDLDQAERLEHALAQAGAEQVDAYLELFFTGTGDARKTLVTKKLAGAHPDLAPLMEREAARIEPLRDRRRAAATRDRTRALLVIATAVADNYRRAKDEKGLLDYDDLIDRTLAMLDRTPSSWVHFKLDQGIDHVLIDEAQDTSPRQWTIVEHLVSEFAAGAGARAGGVRTLFAVGDEKQSIFSFQGAAPREFDWRRRRFRARFEAAGLKFESVSFAHSFRSGAGVLHAVERTFRSAEIFRSITSDEAGMPEHVALADAAPATVELWELEEPDARPELEGWSAPFDAVSERSPDVRLAQRIRDGIRDLLAAGTATGVGSKRRRVSYGDMLVLVRRRGRTFNAVIQVLKQAGMPVAGADRLKLTEHIAVIDLMNLADALLFEGDDLALAVALKSPLFGLTDDDLFTLAFGRRGSLRAALDRHAAGNARIADALARLRRYEARARRDTPFAFFAWLLGGDGGRGRILRRLGSEANDAIDEFLELALNHERRAPASLQGFVAWLRAADTEVKRDMEISRDEIRVMTVHGAKGLEAPVVFLADTASSPTDTQRLNLIRLPGRTHDQGGCVVWAGRKADDPPAVAEARAAMMGEAEDEYRRLLYVAMTRAADRLVVGGCLPGNRKEVRPQSWYDLIRQGLDASELAVETIATAHGPVRRYFRAADTALPAPAAVEVAAPAAALPDWLQRRAAAEPAGETVLRPSGDGDDEGRAFRPGEPASARARALRRGVLVHRLLQSLPAIAAERRGEAAARYLARNAADWDQPDRDEVARAVLALLETLSFAPLFGPGSRAEVSVVGRLPRPGRPPLAVAGQVDRLVVTGSEVLIIDYKTAHAPPATPAEAPAAYLRQLALYRQVLRQIYPDRTVRAALIWTEVPEIMEFPASMLDAELARVILL